MIQATAPAKIILLGEHAVVYDQPAIAIPISQLRATASIAANEPGGGLQIIASDLGLTFPIRGDTDLENNPLSLVARLVLDELGAPTPDFTVNIHSDIPLASGLGSGAAISTVIARGLSAALNHPLNDSELNDLVFQAERIHHGSPSGVDNTVIVYEHPVYFIRGQTIDFLSISGAFHFLIGDTGISALTRVAVAAVRELYDNKPDQVGAIFASIGKLVSEARSALEIGDPATLGSLMNQNHAYLQQLTVSTPGLDRLVQAALNAGALGAKLSGGGRGGNMIALVTEETIPDVREALLDAGAVRVFHTILN